MRRLFRAGSAVAVLLAGLVVLAVGGAGFLTDLFRMAGSDSATAQSVSFALAGLVPPVVLFGVTYSLTNASRPRKLAGGGVLVATVSALGSVLGSGLQSLPVSLGSPLATILSLGYGLGIVLSLGALLDAVSTFDSIDSPTRSRVGWQARDRTGTPRSRRSGSGAAPADGGSTDSELSFPLDRSETDESDTAEDSEN